MFNPVEPSAEQPSGRTWRRLSIGRMFYWSFLLGIPLAGIAGGIALLIASNQLDAAVQTYRNAEPCRSAPTSAACYATVPGTLAKFSITRGKTGDTADMTLQLVDGTRSTWARTNWQQEDALHVGAPILAKSYQGAITAVYLGAIGIETKDSPVYKQSDMRLGAVLIPTLGLIIAAATFFTMRGQRQVTVGSLVAIDRTLPIAEQEALVRRALLGEQAVQPTGRTADAQPVDATLPFILRPHSMPTGRPWWVAPIAVAIAVPLLLLRSRTPASVAQVVLAVTVAGIVVGIVLHWLYRNRRVLVVDDVSVRRMNLFGFSRIVARSDIARLAFPIVSSFALPTLEPRLLILDASGRCLLSLRRYYPTDEEAVQLAAVLRVPLDLNRAKRLASAARLRRTIPGAVSWSEAHPILMSVLVTPPVLVLIVLLIWLLDGFKWSS
jgi:hypothetical protein